MTPIKSLTLFNLNFFYFPLRIIRTLDKLKFQLCPFDLWIICYICMYKLWIVSLQHKSVTVRAQNIKYTTMYHTRVTVIMTRWTLPTIVRTFRSLAKSPCIVGFLFLSFFMRTCVRFGERRHEHNTVFILLTVRYIIENMDHFVPRTMMNATSA